jgi:hypothetical protein
MHLHDEMLAASTGRSFQDTKSRVKRCRMHHSQARFPKGDALHRLMLSCRLLAAQCPRLVKLMTGPRNRRGYLLFQQHSVCDCSASIDAEQVPLAIGEAGLRMLFHQPGEGGPLSPPSTCRRVTSQAVKLFEKERTPARFHRTGQPVQIAVALPKWDETVRQNPHSRLPVS